MKLVIFGSTGSVGRHLVAQSLEAGHAVTAFSRSGALEPQPGLSIVRGDVMDPADVDRAVAGHDAVLCVLGGGLTGHVRSAGTANIIAAMKRQGVRRLICQSTLGAGVSWGNLSLWWKTVMFGALLRFAFADHQKQEALVRESGLDWTIVRPAAFTDGPLTGRYRHGFSAKVRDLALKVSRADVAHFILRELAGGTYSGRAAGLSY